MPVVMKLCCKILIDLTFPIHIIENLENSAVATGLEKVSFHSNPKERQNQRMFKLLHDCTHDSMDCNNYKQSWNQVSINHRRVTEVVQEQMGFLELLRQGRAE